MPIPLTRITFLTRKSQLNIGFLTLPVAHVCFISLSQAACKIWRTGQTGTECFSLYVGEAFLIENYYPIGE